MKVLGHAVAINNTSDINLTCAIEEMSELTKELCKFKRGMVSTKNMVEEISHVVLMCYTLMDMYGLDELTILKEAEKAVQKMYAHSSAKYDPIITNRFFENTLKGDYK